MAGDPENEIREGRQRLHSKNWRFSTLPSVILGVLLLVLIWEIVRQNKDTDKWPWTLKLLGVAPAATLCGVFAGLLFAREQFARSMRPNLLWTCHLINSEILNGEAWTVYLMNVGPGMANIESLRYSLLLSGPTAVIHKEGLTHHEAVTLLKNIGLEHNTHYYLEFFAPGAPLPVTKQRSEALEFAAFKAECLEKIGDLIFVVSITDVMGDHHTKSLPFFATLPEPMRSTRPVILSCKRN